MAVECEKLFEVVSFCEGQQRVAHEEIPCGPPP